MGQTDRFTYDAPCCRTLMLAPGHIVLSSGGTLDGASTKDLKDYEDL